MAKAFLEARQAVSGITTLPPRDSAETLHRAAPTTMNVKGQRLPRDPGYRPGTLPSGSANEREEA